VIDGGAGFPLTEIVPLTPNWLVFHDWPLPKPGSVMVENELR